MSGLVCGWLDKVGFVLCGLWWGLSVGGAGWVPREGKRGGDIPSLEVSL